VDPAKSLLFPAPAVARSSSRRLAGIAAYLLAGAVIGQSPLVTAYSGAGVGVAGSQMFFDLTVIPAAGITIKSLDVNLSSVAGTAGFITVIPQAPARTYTSPGATITSAWWTPPSVGSVTAQGVGRPSHVCITPPLFLLPGVQGIVVQYTTVAPQYTVNPPIPPAPWPTASTAEVILSRGDYAPVPWLPPAPGPNTFDGAIHYEVGAATPCLTCADRLLAGAGCASACSPFPVLQLDSGYPVLGGSFDIVTSNYSPCSYLGVTVLGTALISPLGGLIPIPPFTCLWYVQPDVELFVTTTASGRWTNPVHVPAVAAYCGFVFYAQSCTFENPNNVASSNYVTLTVGG
jgi:hypothetical protein